MDDGGAGVEFRNYFSRSWEWADVAWNTLSIRLVESDSARTWRDRYLQLTNLECYGIKA